MGFIGDDRKAFAFCGSQFAHGFQCERKSLDGANHNFLVTGERLGQLAALAAVLIGDGSDHANGALKVEQRFLKLRVDHVAVGDHQHGIEHLSVVGIVQLGQKVRRPCDGIGFATACAVLDEVLSARPVVEHCGLEFARHVELMKPRKDDLFDLLLLVALGDEVAAQNFQPAFARPYLLPQIRCPMPALRVHRIARRAIVA